MEGGGAKDETGFLIHTTQFLIFSQLYFNLPVQDLISFRIPVSIIDATPH